jgi:D-lactate dehydrogenase
MSTAIDILKATTYFHDASDSFLQELSKRMIPMEVEDGHIFIEESEPMTIMLIVEEGTLVRTKLAIDKENLQAVRTSMKQLKSSIAQSTESVLIDEITGRGTITGMLHNLNKEGEISMAYATVSSKGPKTKVWVLSGDDFKAAVAANPEHTFEALHALARELRTGSKSLQGLLQKARATGTAAVEKDGSIILRCLCYDTTGWVKEGFQPVLDAFNQEHKGTYKILMDYTSERLSDQSATYAVGYDCICLFVNDVASNAAIHTLSLLGVKMIAMRCAGFDRVDTRTALAHHMTVVRVPAYSPYAVAEHGIALLMALNRKVVKASNRVSMANFALDGGLMGMDIHGKTVGVMGTGKIGQILCTIIKGFGAKLICYDVYESKEVKEMGGTYVTQDELFAQSDVIFLMMPLFPSTHHTINDTSISKMKKGVLLINTSRGGLIDTAAALRGLKSGTIAGLGIDVYENEGDYFFQDWSAKTIEDPILTSLLGETNVILTAHQAFFTKEAVDNIVATTVENMKDYMKGMTGFNHPNNCLPKPETPK